MKFPWQRRLEGLSEVDAALENARLERAKAEHDQAVAHELSRWARERAAVKLDRMLANGLRNR